MRKTPHGNAMSTLATALVLVVGMGFGRFAFTGLYPLMVQEGCLTVDGGSYAASANYLGYLLGAMLAATFPPRWSEQMCLLALLTIVLSLGLLGLPLSEPLIIAVRAGAGVSSALALIGASQWLIQVRGHAAGAPGLFSGVGLGILISGELIAAGRSMAMKSGPIWVLLAAACVLFSVASYVMMSRSGDPEPVAASGKAQTPCDCRLPAGRLITMYGLAGFGYIVTATYLPLLVRTALGAIDPVHIWAGFGLFAVPSCYFWHALHGRWGTQRSLVVNLFAQATGVVLPALVHSPLAYMGSAVLVGGTFMGTVTIAMPAARRVADTVRFNMLALMTACYGTGQIAGPLLAGAIYSRLHSFDWSLMLAAVALAVGGVLGLLPVRSETVGEPG